MFEEILNRYLNVRLYVNTAIQLLRAHVSFTVRPIERSRQTGQNMFLPHVLFIKIISLLLFNFLKSMSVPFYLNSFENGL